MKALLYYGWGNGSLWDDLDGMEAEIRRDLEAHEPDIVLTREWAAPPSGLLELMRSVLSIETPRGGIVVANGRGLLLARGREYIGCVSAVRADRSGAPDLGPGWEAYSNANYRFRRPATLDLEVAGGIITGYFPICLDVEPKTGLFDLALYPSNCRTMRGLVRKKHSAYFCADSRVPSAGTRGVYYLAKPASDSPKGEEAEHLRDAYGGRGFRRLSEFEGKGIGRATSVSPDRSALIELYDVPFAPRLKGEAPSK